MIANASAQFRDPSAFVKNVARFLYVDYAYFQSETDPKTNRLEIYYLLYNRGLEFKEQGKEHVAAYEVAVAINDDDGTRVASESRDRTIKVKNEDKARSRLDFRSSQFNSELPPGKYMVRILVRDKSNGQVHQEEIEIKMRDLRRKTPTLSEVLFSQGFRPSGGAASVFDKGNLAVIPSVTRSFGGNENSKLAYYLEVYQGREEMEKVVIETKIRHDRKGMKYRDTLHVTLAHGVERELREVSLTQFVPGDYQMEIILRGRRNKKLDERKYEFSVLLSPEAMIRSDWKSTVTQLKILDEPATDGFKDLVTYEERLRAYDEFWLEHDPTPGTAANEVKREFYRRVAVADHNFSRFRRPGWKSDRGQTFIEYGTPDQVDDEPFLPNSMPFQIWHYYTQGPPYRRFLFVDENNDGEYRLQWPFDGLNQTPDF